MSPTSRDCCAECGSADLEVVGTREIRRPRAEHNEPPAACKIQVRCRECGWTDLIVRPATR